MTASGGFVLQLQNPLSGFVGDLIELFTAQLQGLADTGNSLVDFFSGKPVIICDGTKFADIAPSPSAPPPKGFRLLPCETVSGNGLIPVFQPDEVVIYAERTGRYRKVDALIGIGERENERAIFNPKILY